MNLLCPNESPIRTSVSYTDEEQKYKDPLRMVCSPCICNIMVQFFSGVECLPCHIKQLSSTLLKYQINVLTFQKFPGSRITTSSKQKNRNW